MSNLPYQNATWKSLTGVSWIIQGPQPSQVSSALWALRTLRHVRSCYSLQWIQTGSLLSIFITIPSGSVLAGFCNENPAQSTLWHAASSLKIVRWHTAIITHINTLHCAVWRFVPVAWLIPALGAWWDGRKELTFPKRQSSAPGAAPSPWKRGSRGCGLIHPARRELAPTLPARFHIQTVQVFRQDILAPLEPVGVVWGECFKKIRLSMKGQPHRITLSPNYRSRLLACQLHAGFQSNPYIQVFIPFGATLHELC